MTQTHVPPQFAKRVMAMVNSHGWDAGEFSAQIERLFTAWIAAEGGTTAWNPLDCTLWLPGATVYNTFISNGQPLHVWNYTRATDGCCATALTLVNGSYPGILGAIQGAQLAAEQIVKERSNEFHIWGTNPDTILAVLATTP